MPGGLFRAGGCVLPTEKGRKKAPAFFRPFLLLTRRVSPGDGAS
ncbi:hypothetical protein J2792_000671 [Novosphingobium capsulatum]|uniref:Uncharacterized protein n=1 Tax=Novosphingobium capsulatum TaxID=13688 RepID=A0ABU1MHP4_9SPHN|nr:hypothetical protein [Novosphingobium capsulatum]